MSTYLASRGTYHYSFFFYLLVSNPSDIAFGFVISARGIVLYGFRVTTSFLVLGFLPCPSLNVWFLFSVLNLLCCCHFGSSCPLLAEYPESHQVTTVDLMVPATMLPLVQIYVAAEVICTAARSVSPSLTLHHFPEHDHRRFLESTLCLVSTPSFPPSFEVHIRICHPTLLESPLQRS